MHWIKAAIVRTLIVSCLGCTPLLAAETSPSTIRFGVMQLIPYGYYDEQRKPKGYIYELAQAILKEGQFNGSASIQPMKRLGHNILVKKQLDCSMFGDVPYARENYVLIEPVDIHLEFGILPRKGVHLQHYDDLRNITIGVPLGIRVGYPFDTDTSLRKIQATDYEGGVLMLKHSRFDAIAGVIESLKLAGTRSGITAESYDKPLVFKRVPFWVLCRPGFADAKLTQRLQQAIQNLHHSGEVERIYRRYAPPN